MQTHCSHCQAPMQCGVDQASCWCQGLPSLPADQLQASAGCLCQACLSAKIAYLTAVTPTKLDTTPSKTPPTL